MYRDDERIGRVKRALRESDFDAVVCALPANVLLLSGYCPIVGSSLIVATSDGRIALIIPEDERELAEQGWADELHVFQPGSLEEIVEIVDAVRDPLAEAAESLGIRRGRVLGYEDDAMFEPITYASMHLYNARITELIADAIPLVTLKPAGKMLARLRSVLTPGDTERVRFACQIAGGAFTDGARKIRAGLKETEVAALFRQPLNTEGTGYKGIARADGFVFCMSGANAAKAHAAYQRSRERELAPGDFALIHCNSYADGYWTDITRTYCVGEADERKREMYQAVFAARRAALAAIHPGARAADADKAAREELKARGFGTEFKHPTGHGVGFSAINHNALPRLHPKSEDLLEAGMVFNVEPAIYIDGYGGLRHCDMVAVTETGAEVLTPFQTSVEQLIVN